jgi:hypothetical protein
LESYNQNGFFHLFLNTRHSLNVPIVNGLKPPFQSQKASTPPTGRQHCATQEGFHAFPSSPRIPSGECRADFLFEPNQTARAHSTASHGTFIVFRFPLIGFPGSISSVNSGPLVFVKRAIVRQCGPPAFEGLAWISSCGIGSGGRGIEIVFETVF